MTFNELLALDKQGGSKRTGKWGLQPAEGKVLFSAKKLHQPKAGAGAGENDTMIPRHHGIMTPSMVERLRRAVRQVGKEAATHRFTAEEKKKLADIIYAYGRQGYRTSENELVRIGVNWLIEDYRENGKQSLLHQALKALKE